MKGRKKLTAAFVRTAMKGRYSDGAYGLILQVKGQGARQWLQRLTLNGRRREFGLGGTREVSLSEARIRAAENWLAVRRGENPFRRPVIADQPVFRNVAADWIASRGWTPKTRQQATSRFESFVYPRIGNWAVADVDTLAIERVLRPLWESKLDTGKKVKQLLFGVMQRAEALGLVTGNPVESVGALLGPGKPAAAKTGFRALKHHRLVPVAIEAVHGSTAQPVTKLATEFTILTAARSGEVRAARWAEVNWDEALWTVPADRMKNGKPHVVPLSDRAVAILRQAQELAGGSEWVFPAVRSRRPMSDATLTKCLRVSGVNSTLHGFRSSFRDWCGDNDIRRDIAEFSLSHTVPNATEKAYYRTRLIDRRRDVMKRWADYLAAGQS